MAEDPTVGPAWFERQFITMALCPPTQVHSQTRPRPTFSVGSEGLLRLRHVNSGFGGLALEKQQGERPEFVDQTSIAVLVDTSLSARDPLL